jgi:ATP/maltotriose-dependent transcriptional regulator MalT
MNNIPVLKSKLIMPELSASFLLTDRLQRLHESMDSCTAVSVCAPAGYGKTTLAVSYFNHQAAEPCRVAWYRLDPEDSNTPVFMAHLTEALFPSEDAGLAESRQILEGQTDMRLQPHQALVTICREMWAQHSRGEYTRTYLVLDDFHNVAQNQDICDITRFMLDNLPPSWSIFVLSRALHEVFTEKQKLEKEIIEINADDLAFSSAEIEDLMLSMGQATANRKLTDTITKTTEGWIAGIIILWQAVKGRNLETAAMESSHLINKDALFRYMSLEVLKSVPGDIQDALARLALLQDFSEPEAAEILNIHDIKSLMEQCLDFGMFVQRIPGVPVIYRFHSLFREFLLYILHDRYAEELIDELHLRAAGYYMQHDTFGRAAEHLANCGNTAAAIDMVTQAGFNKFMIGETGQLKMWLDLLPEDMIGNNPILLLFKAQLMPNSQQLEMVDTLKRVLELSLQDSNLALYYDAASVLIYIYMCSNDMNGLRDMTAGFPQDVSYVAAELRSTSVIVYMVRSLGEERFSAAQAQSESILYTQLPEDSQWLYLFLSCIVYYCLGKLDEAQQCMETALTLNKFKNIEPSQGFILLFLATVLSLKNEKDDLPSHLAEVSAIGEKYDYEYLSAHGRRLVALERYLSFDAEASLELLDQAVFHFRHINNRAMAEACRLLRCLWAIKPNGPAPDLKEARQDLTLIRNSSPGMMAMRSPYPLWELQPARRVTLSRRNATCFHQSRRPRPKKEIRSCAGPVSI